MSGTRCAGPATLRAVPAAAAARSALLAWLVIAAVMGDPGTARAQAPERERTSVAQGLRSVEPGATVRVWVRELGVVEGTLVRIDHRGLTVSADHEERLLPIQRVYRLEVRQRATGRGALIGAAVLGIGGAAFGALVGQGVCDAADCSGAWIEPAIALGLLGGAGGAGAGAVIGALVHRWDARYP